MGWAIDGFCRKMGEALGVPHQYINGWLKKNSIPWCYASQIPDDVLKSMFPGGIPKGDTRFQMLRSGKCVGRISKGFYRWLFPLTRPGRVVVFSPTAAWPLLSHLPPSGCAFPFARIPIRIPVRLHLGAAARPDVPGPKEKTTSVKMKLLQTLSLSLSGSQKPMNAKTKLLMQGGGGGGDLAVPKPEGAEWLTDVAWSKILVLDKLGVDGDDGSAIPLFTNYSERFAKNIDGWHKVFVSDIPQESEWPEDLNADRYGTCPCSLLFKDRFRRRS